MSHTIHLTGKPMKWADVAAVLTNCGFVDIHNSLIAEGYKLQPVRAPRAVKRTATHVTFRFAWKSPGSSVVIRMVRDVPLS